MRIFVSSPKTDVLDEILKRCPGMKLNVLLTMARMPGNFPGFLEKYKGIIDKLALDSGTFSLENSNLDISPQQLFARFVGFTKESGHHFDLLFSFDEEFGPNGFEVNSMHLAELEERGVKVIPVSHNVKNHELDTFINAGYEYVAIGKQDGKTSPEVLFPAVFKLHHHGIKVHLFGITDFSLISGCPAWSCDSKSWLDDAKTGIVRFWNPMNPGIDKTDLIYFPNELGKKKGGTYVYSSYEHIDEFTKFINSVGLTTYDLIGTEGERYREFLGMLYYKTIEGIVTDMHLSNPLFL